MAKRRATRAEMHRRIREIYELVLSDTPAQDIVIYGKAKWSLEKNQIEKYIKAAHKEIRQQAKTMQRNMLDRHLTQRSLIRNKALKSGDLRLASSLLQDEARLLGLYPRPTVKAEVSWESYAPEGTDPATLVNDFADLIVNNQDFVEVLKEAGLDLS